MTEIKSAKLIDTNKVPKYVKETSKSLKEAGFESFLVGGCVRDLIIGREPKDWDITTNATPEKIQSIFPDSFYENNFGTVGVKVTLPTNPSNDSDTSDNSKSLDEITEVIEITPYRIESKYTDKRHPDEVKFSENIDDDLKRRDFTINALAFDIENNVLKDNFKGQDDLSSGLIRTVGGADDRFQEDALRMLRAVRFSAELGFLIEQETAESIVSNVDLLENVSRERIGEEFRKIIMSDNPSMGLGMAQKLGIMAKILPIFEESVDVKQNKKAHKYDVWEHSLRTLQHAADKKLSLELRLAALFHDVAKPVTKREVGDKTTFYNHDVVGAKVTRETLKSLSFSTEVVKKVEKLVRYHMFFADTNQITLSAVRRLIAKVGKDSIWDLIDLRMCDRIGTGRPKEQPYRLRKFQSMIEEVSRDPISVSMLKIDGNYLIKKFHVQPGPRIGHILHALLEEVIENPQNNTEMFLVKRTEELLQLPDDEIQKLGDKGREILEEKESEEIEKIRKERHVN